MTRKRVVQHARRRVVHYDPMNDTHTALEGASPDDVRLGRRRRRSVPDQGKWKLTVRWSGPACNLPIVALKKVAWRLPPTSALAVFSAIA